MKSPLKSNINFKSTSVLKKLIPPKSTVSSFFLYSAEIEIALATQGCTVVAHTNKAAIYEFWATALTRPRVLCEAATHLFPTLLPPQFHILQETWTEFRHPLDRSAIFFILNRCSDNGSVSCGTITKENFNPIALSHLKNFQLKGFYPYYDKCENALDGLAAATKTDYMLLPIGNYGFNLFEYGKSKGPDTTPINHRELAERMKGVDRKWFLLYKNHPALFKEYKDYTIKMIDKYGRPTEENSRCEELIIANF